MAEGEESPPDEEPAPEEKEPDDPLLFVVMYPAATKKTGSYVVPPVFVRPKRRPDETVEQFREREKEERRRLPRPRKKSGGWCFAFPDVCYLPTDPPMPFPFPNWGFLKDAVGCISTVLAEMKPIVVETSEIPFTTGDEPGVRGGVLSGTVASKVTFLEYSSKILITGKSVVYLGCRTAQNNYNIIGKFSAPAQNKIQVAP